MAHMSASLKSRVNCLYASSSKLLLVLQSMSRHEVWHMAVYVHNTVIRSRVAVVRVPDPRAQAFNTLNFRHKVVR